MFIISYEDMTVNLPSPELGDSIDYDLQVNLKFANDGTSYTYIRKPILENRAYDFAHVPAADVARLRNLIRKYKDKLLNFVSYDGETFTGKIVNTPRYVVTNYTPCVFYSLSLDIQK